MKTHFPTKLSPARPVYEILLPTCWKKIALKGELNPDNNIDTDGDTLTDWEEVDTERLIWNEDGSFEIPTFNISELVNHLKRYQSSDYKFLFNDIKNDKPRYYLPILSDPTEENSDGDGLRDDEDCEPLTVFLNELLEKLKLMEQYIDDYYENQYTEDMLLYDDAPSITTPNSTIAINIIRNLYYGSEKIIKDNMTLKDHLKNYKQQIQWEATDGTSFPLIRKYIDKKDSSIIDYFKKYRSNGDKQLIDNKGNEIDFLHLLATLGAERYDGIIDPNLAGWAGDLQSFIYNLKIETYGKVYDYGDLTKSEKFTEIAYDMFTGAIQVPKNQFTNEDLLADVDAKNINEIYSENLKLSSALRGYYTKHYKSRFTNFISYYGGKDKFYELVGEYTEGYKPIKHMLLNKFAGDAATEKDSPVKAIYEASYVGTIQGMPIYSLQNPEIITEEESIALRNGFCQWIDLKLSEERNMS